MQHPHPPRVVARVACLLLLALLALPRADMATARSARRVPPMLAGTWILTGMPPTMRYHPSDPVLLRLDQLGTQLHGLLYMGPDRFEILGTIPPSSPYITLRWRMPIGMQAFDNGELSADGSMLGGQVTGAQFTLTRAPRGTQPDLRLREPETLDGVWLTNLGPQGAQQTFTLHQQGARITGSVAGAGYHAPLNGVFYLADDNMRISWKAPDGPASLTAGALPGVNPIVVGFQLTTGGSGGADLQRRSFPKSAVPSALPTVVVADPPLNGLNGRWRLDGPMPDLPGDGVRFGLLALTQRQARLSGTLSSGPFTMPISGTIGLDGASLTMTWPEQQGLATCTGAIASTKLSIMGNLLYAGQSGACSFTRLFDP